ADSAIHRDRRSVRVAGAEVTVGIAGAELRTVSEAGACKLCRTRAEIAVGIGRATDESRRAGAAMRGRTWPDVAIEIGCAAQARAGAAAPGRATAELAISTVHACLRLTAARAGSARVDPHAAAVTAADGPRPRCDNGITIGCRDERTAPDAAVPGTEVELCVGSDLDLANAEIEYCVWSDVDGFCHRAGIGIGRADVGGERRLERLGARRRERQKHGTRERNNANGHRHEDLSLSTTVSRSAAATATVFESAEVLSGVRRLCPHTKRDIGHVRTRGLRCQDASYNSSS